jgi:transposase InsO family protein
LFYPENLSYACKIFIKVVRELGRTKHQMKLFAPTDSVVNLRSGIADFKQYYNYRRPHQSLVKIIPAMEYGIAV